MSARTVLHDIYKAPLLMADPGDAGTIRPTKSLGVVPLVTATSETRTVAVPAKAGLMMTLYMHTDGGDCVVTFTSGYDQYGSTTCTFNDAGDFITVISVATATDTFRWRVLAYDGVSGPAVNMSCITMTGTTGAQEIRLSGNLADALSIEDSTGDMMVFVTTTSAKEIRVDKTTIFQVGISANTAGSGVPLTVSRTGALRVQCDDGGVALTPSGSVPDIRCVMGRFLVSADQSAIHARVHGVFGLARVYDALWNEEQLNGVNGRLELVQSAGTTTVAGYGISSGVCGILATAGTVLVNTYHVAAAVSAIADIKGTVTQTGKCVGVLVAPYDTTNWSDSTSRAKFGYGIWIHPDASTRGIFVGTLGSDTTSGLPIGGATALNGFYADDSGASQTASTVWRNMEARTYFSVDQTGAASDFYSIRGHLKTGTSVANMSGDTSVRASIQGYLETAHTTGVTVGAGAFLSAVHGEVWSDGNLTGTGKLAGVMSRIYFASGKSGSGIVAAFMATKQWASAATWPYGLYIDAAAVGVYMTGAATGIKMTGAVTQVFDFTSLTTAIAEDDKAYDTKAGSIKILMPSGGAAYINVYDGSAS